MNAAQAFGPAYCKARIMKSFLDISFLAREFFEKEDYAQNIEFLKHHFGLSGENVFRELNEYHIQRVYGVYKVLPPKYRVFIKYLLLKYDVMNLKMFIRRSLQGQASGTASEFYYNTYGMSFVKYSYFSTAEKVDELIRLLKGTIFFSPLRHGFVHFKEDGNPVHFDAELFKLYKSALRGLDNPIIKWFLAVDTVNLLMKLQKVYELSEDQIVRYIVENPNFVERWRDRERLEILSGLFYEIFHKQVYFASEADVLRATRQKLGRYFCTFPFKLEVIIAFILYEQWIIDLIIKALSAHKVGEATDVIS